MVSTPKPQPNAQTHVHTCACAHAFWHTPGVTEEVTHTRGHGIHGQQDLPTLVLGQGGVDGPNCDVASRCLSKCTADLLSGRHGGNEDGSTHKTVVTVHNRHEAVLMVVIWWSFGRHAAAPMSTTQLTSESNGKSLWHGGDCGAAGTEAGVAGGAGATIGNNKKYNQPCRCHSGLSSERCHVPLFVVLVVPMHLE